MTRRGGTFIAGCYTRVLFPYLFYYQISSFKAILFPKKLALHGGWVDVMVYYFLKILVKQKARRFGNLRASFIFYETSKSYNPDPHLHISQAFVFGVFA